MNLSEHTEEVMTIPRPSAGDILFTRVTCDVWSEDLDETVETLKKGSMVLVVQKGCPKYPKRLNVQFYRKILTPQGNTGWIHLDNCKIDKISL
jgi:hypothetical protein